MARVLCELGEPGEAAHEEEWKVRDCACDSRCVSRCMVMQGCEL